mgnify:CR=1 FL=1
MFEWLKRNKQPLAEEVRTVTFQDVYGNFTPGEILDIVAADNKPFTIERALGLTAIWAAVNYLSDKIASLPLQTFETGAEDREPLRDDPVYKLLHDSPNPEWTAYDFWKYFIWQVLTEGRGLAFISRALNGKIVALYPMDPVRVTVKLVNMRRRYIYREDDGTVNEYDSSEVIDVPYALERDQVSHISPLRRNKGSILLGLGIQEYAQKLFSNGGVPPLALEGPFNTAEAVQRASNDVTNAIKEAAAQGKKVLPIPLGHKLAALGIDPEKGQMVDSRTFQIQEAARIYGLPPMLLQELSGGTFNNAEQQDLQVVKNLLAHWVERIEQQLDLKLFRAGNRFAEFNLEGLQRGDFKTRMDGYSKGIQNSIYTPNEVRKKENLPTLDGGNDLVIQQNMQPVTSLNKQTKEAPTNDD